MEVVGLRRATGDQRAGAPAYAKGVANDRGYYWKDY